MSNSGKIIYSVCAAFLSIGHTGLEAASSLTSNEKCYGITRAGMNDCATATQSCAGSATKDSQADAFLFLPRGTCEKIVGGKIKP